MKQLKLIAPALLVGIGLMAGPALAKDNGKNKGHGKKADKTVVVHRDHRPDVRYTHDDRNRHYHAQSGKHDNGRRGPPPWAKGKDYRSYGYDRVVYVPISDYDRYRLYDPRDGQRWMRDDSGRYLLVSIATGVIADILTRGL